MRECVIVLMNEYLNGGQKGRRGRGEEYGKDVTKMTWSKRSNG